MPDVVGLVAVAVAAVRAAAHPVVVVPAAVAAVEADGVRAAAVVEMAAAAAVAETSRLAKPAPISSRTWSPSTASPRS